MRRVVIVALAVLALAGCASTGAMKDGAITPKQAQALEAQKLIEHGEALNAEMKEIGVSSHSVQKLWHRTVSSFQEKNFDAVKQASEKFEQAASLELSKQYRVMALIELQFVSSLVNKNREQYEAQQQIRLLMNGGEYKAAYQNAIELNSELLVAQITYMIEIDESLASIAQRHALYGNPNWWPLIYLDNGEAIKSPDSLQKGTSVRVRLHPKQDELKLALAYAKYRASLSPQARADADATFLDRFMPKSGNAIIR